MKGRKNWLKKLLPVRQQVGRQVWAAGCASRVWGKEHNCGIYVGNINLVCYWKAFQCQGDGCNLRKCLGTSVFHSEARSDAVQSWEHAVSAQRQRVPRQRCWERPGCQNSSALLQRLQVVIAFQVVDLRSDVFRTGDEGEVEKQAT